MTAADKKKNYFKSAVSHFLLIFDKLSYAVRLSEENILISVVKGVSELTKAPLLSFHFTDISVGIVGALAVKGILYLRSKNAKKFRKGIEYGSARWGTPEDIKPYIDEDFFSNILLTNTERLTMNSRPINPKFARNKNVLVIGGSGSGKTRFFVKPNLMQMTTSYCVTDPKGTILVECGKNVAKRRLQNPFTQYDKFQKEYALQSLCLYTQRKGYFEAGKCHNRKHQRRRRKNLARIFGLRRNGFCIAL